MIYTAILGGLLINGAAAFPWVAKLPGVDNSLWQRDVKPRQAGSAATCPVNPNHAGAVPFNPKFPYCGAANGAPGFQVCVNNLVPAKGDLAHQYIAPGPNDIRGPCPGLNTAANHGFLSRDGITTYSELLDAQQNVYGVGYDLASLLAALGVSLDGDIVTEKLSLGCDATSRTSANGATSGEVGLDGHNRFEGDSSLTRNDYFTHNGDNFLFNQTLYKMMSDYANGNFNRDNIARYRYARYQQSKAENGNFYFGPKSLLLYGAASFLYELFPSLGELGKPDQTTMDFFFKSEQLPPNWFSRVDPYSIPLVAAEIFALYQEYPVAFGGNTGKPNSFVGVGEKGPYIDNSMFSGTAQGVECLLYQIATDNEPSFFNTVPTANLQWAASKLNPIYKNLTAAGSPCPLNFADA